jgi:glycosyltransferase involved in cell wall biosynthesis
VHILFLTENFPPEVNASATRVYERAVYWVKAGHEVTVVTCFPNFPQGRLYDGWRQHIWQIDYLDGIRVIRLPTYIARNEGFVRRTADFVSFMIASVVATPWLPSVDVVVATSPQFFAAVAGWVIAAMRRRPFVFELGDLWPASIRAVGAMRESVLLDALERLELFLYRRSAAVVALTQSFKADLTRRGIDPKKIAVVINGVDLPRYSPHPKDSELVAQLALERAFTVGYLGTHGLAHDLGNVLAAADRLRAYSDIRFLLVGDGAAKPALRLASDERGLASVVFVDPQPKARIPAFWGVCDVALVHLKNDPVFAEVIPSKIFEAMAMGLPVLLVAPLGEATRIVEREQAGIVVEAGNPDALAKAVLRLRDDVDLRLRLAANSLNAAQRYSRKFQADSMIAVLDRVITGGVVAPEST